MIKRLPEVVLAGLYKDTLVVTDQPLQNQSESPQQVTNKKSIEELSVQPSIKKWFLGDNKKNIVILVNDNSAVHISEEWLGTLSRLLNACNLNLGDVAIINYKKEPRTFEELKEKLQPQFLFMFDVTTADVQLPFTIPHYQAQKFSGCIFMTAPVVALSSENSMKVKNEKRNLWEKLKTIFNV